VVTPTIIFHLSKFSVFFLFDQSSKGPVEYADSHSTSIRGQGGILNVRQDGCLEGSINQYIYKVMQSGEEFLRG
jgi:hypothetical protein